MVRTRLVIVEGLPGLGKSTTAQHLAIELEKRAIPCRWYYEAEPDNPVSGFYEPQFYSSPREFVAAQESRWREFARECAERTSLSILESSLFQETIFGLLQYNVPQEQIRAFVRDIVHIIAPLQPVVVYLFHEQPAVAINQVCSMRGRVVEDVYVERNDLSPFARQREMFGFLGLARFWAEYKDIADSLYDALRFRKLRLDVTHGHTPEHHERLRAFLDLPPVADQPISREYLDRFTGAYAYHVHEDLRSFEVAVKDDNLVVKDCPYLWPENRLIPRDLNVFYAESWPYMAIFEETSSGRVSGMLLEDRGQSSQSFDAFEKVL
jgi:deoxyadenosine/deoxycytidine kinase